MSVASLPHPLFPILIPGLLSDKTWRITAPGNPDQVAFTAFDPDEWRPSMFYGHGGEVAEAFIDSREWKILYLNDLMSPDNPAMAWNIEKVPLSRARKCFKGDPERYWMLPRRTLHAQMQSARRFARHHVHGAEKADMSAAIEKRVNLCRVSEDITEETDLAWELWENAIDRCLLVQFFRDRGMEPQSQALAVEGKRPDISRRPTLN